ncbi:MAG: WxcM-like domain-containing protein [Candidatus Scalinduaceae bacterium]
MKGVRLIKLDKKEDHRGWFLKILMNHQIEGKREFGEIYLSTAYPGETKGNHYHNFATEWFCLIKGKAILSLMDIKTKQKENIMLGEEIPMTIEVSPQIAHSVKNQGEDSLFLLAYSDTPYDQQNADSIPFSL